MVGEDRDRWWRCCEMTVNGEVMLGCQRDDSGITASYEKEDSAKPLRDSNGPR